jgi:hypothetical protein
VKNEKEIGLDEYFQRALGMAFDKLNGKLNGSLIFCCWRQQHVTAMPINTNKHTF